MINGDLGGDLSAQSLIEVSGSDHGYAGLKKRMGDRVIVHDVDHDDPTVTEPAGRIFWRSRHNCQVIPMTTRCFYGTESKP